MTQIQQNRYDQLLRRVADLKGTGSKVNDALTELFPMFDVENVPAELLLLAGSRLCMGTISSAAGGVGFFSQTIIRNPGDSGVIARIVAIDARISVIGNIVIGPSQNSLTAGGARAFADTRVFGEGTTLVLQQANNLLSAGSTFYIIRDNTLAGIHFEPPSSIAVLAPGGGLQVSPQGSDRAIDASFIWVERVAQPSELNL